MLGPVGCRLRCMVCPACLRRRLSQRGDKIALTRAFRAFMRPVAPESAETLGDMAPAERADAGRDRPFLAAW